MGIRKHIAVASLLLLNAPVSLAQKECNAREVLLPGSCAGDEIDESERQLAAMINAYRAKHRLPEIPLSASLSLVANRHVRDLFNHFSDKELTHEWSNCRNEDECMWEAPQRLGTVYPKEAFENAYWTGDTRGARADLQDIMDTWAGDGTGAHAAPILNRKNGDADWSQRYWRALGVGIYKGYAVMWLGEELDPAGASGRATRPSR